MDKCPKCKGPAEILKEYVDIGVGTQEFTVGAECPTCGQLGLCFKCGYWDFQGHATWCAELPDAVPNTDEPPF